MTSYIPEGSTIPVTDHKHISQRYMKKGTFYQDLIALLPMTLIFFHNNYFDEFYRLFFLIKVIRIKKGFDIFDVPHIMETVKDFYRDRNQIRIEEDLEFAEDMINDNNNIEFFIQISYALKTLKLAILIIKARLYLKWHAP